MTSFANALQRTVMWMGTGMCEEPSMCRLGQGYKGPLPSPLPCKLFVCSDGVLIIGEVTGLRGGAGPRAVLCDFAPIGQAILVFDTARHVLMMTMIFKTKLPIVNCMYDLCCVWQGYCEHHTEWSCDCATEVTPGNWCRRCCCCCHSQTKPSRRRCGCSRSVLYE